MSAQTLPEKQDDKQEAVTGRPKGFTSELDDVFGYDEGKERERASIEELFANYWNNNPSSARSEPTHPSSQDTSTKWEHRGDGILRASWDVTGGPVTAEVEFLAPEGPMRLTMTHQGRVVHEEEYTDHLAMMEEADRVAAGVDQMESDAAFEAQLAEFEAERERGRRSVAFGETETTGEAKGDRAAFDAEIDEMIAAEERRDAAMFTALDRAAARPEWSLSEGANKAVLEAMDAWAGEPVTMNDPLGFELALVALGQRIASGTLTDEDRRLAAEVVALVRPEMEAAGLFDPMPGEDEKLMPDPWGAPAAGDEERPAPTQADRERVAMAWVQRLETCVGLAEARLRRLLVERDVARAVAASLEDGPEATSLRGVLQKATAVMDADPRVVSARAEFDTVLAEYEAGAAERAKARR